MTTYTIYKHTNKLNGKCYVGQTKLTPDERWFGHLKGAKAGSGMVFHRALRKYGPDAWDHEVLEEVQTKADANVCEIKWIAHFNSTHPKIGYNRTSGGDGGCMSDEALIRLSAKLKNKPKSLEHRQHMSEAASNYWAEHPNDSRREQLAERNASPEMIEIARQAQIRRWSDPQAREEQRQRMVTRIVSDETKQRNSKAMSSLWNDPDYRAKMVEAFKNRPRVSDETRRKQSERMTGKKRGAYKNRGTKRGPRQTSVTCPTCGRTMKFISKRHRCN